MFVGHLAVALVAKRAAPAVNLGWLMAGVTALDLVWPLFVLAGIEHVHVAPGVKSSPYEGSALLVWDVGS